MNLMNNIMEKVKELMNMDVNLAIAIPLTILVMIGMVCLRGGIIYFLWKWISLNFGLPTMSYKIAICIALFIRLFSPKRQD